MCSKPRTAKPAAPRSRSFSLLSVAIGLPRGTPHKSLEFKCQNRDNRISSFLSSLVSHLSLFLPLSLHSPSRFRIPRDRHPSLPRVIYKPGTCYSRFLSFSLFLFSFLSSVVILQCGNKGATKEENFVRETTRIAREHHACFPNMCAGYIGTRYDSVMSYASFDPTSD